MLFWHVWTSLTQLNTPTTSAELPLVLGAALAQCGDSH